MPFDIQQIRAQFPALALEDNGVPRVYLDNPAGTQVPKRVVERTGEYMIRMNANHGGPFRTSQDSDALSADAHRAAAELLNASSPEEIVFGANMTTLTFAISRSLGHWLKPGDEIILTRMDHDANVNPWRLLAKDLGLEVKWLSFNRETYQYDLGELERLLSKRVKLLAVNYASNALGTINDVRAIASMARAVGALTYVDAVQYVPHGPTDVQALGCDFLACSVYKFFGGHQGILWGRGELLEALPAYKVRPAEDHGPGKFETGTQSYEGQAGALGAIEYLAWLGEQARDIYRRPFGHLSGRQQNIHTAMAAIKAYEKLLSAHLIKGLQAISGVTVHGITDPGQFDKRVPTVAFTRKGFAPADIAGRLAEANIFVWDGDYYAVEVVNHLGLADSGGMVRVGPVHYNTIAELDRLLEVVEGM